MAQSAAPTLGALDRHRGQTVVLFYDGFELQSVEALAPRLWSSARSWARHASRTLRRTQVYTGFYVGFRNLVTSLEAAGVEVRVNDFAFARANPRHAVGLCGYPSVLEKVILPNPAMFVFGDFGSPSDAPLLRKRNNIVIFTQPCDWACELYREQLGSDVRPLPVGIDTTEWKPAPKTRKTTDFIVYDKIRWRRDERREDLLQPVFEYLQRRGLTYHVLRYGTHHINEFRRSIAVCRSLIFLCEHETQGLAYQEAMAAGLPVLAWDEGKLVDPHQSRYLQPNVKVSSVPYFDERCGMTFKIGQFEGVCQAFLENLEGFAPRQYVLEELSLRQGARRFLELYDELSSRSES